MKTTRISLITKVLIFILLIGCGGKESKEKESNAEPESVEIEQTDNEAKSVEFEMRNKKFGLFNFMDKLEVLAGQTLTITPENKFIITREWIMGDNSKIVFADGVQTFVVNAEEVKWGENVLIDGRGNKGNDGKNGANGVGRSEAGDCASGNHGGNASSAVDGSDGINMDFTVGLSALGSAKILANGGPGGTGGTGGNGVSGTKGDCSSSCNGGNGGNGGQGGRGGDAGNGGDVTIAYKFLNTGMDIGAITVEVKAGTQGGAGKAGIIGNAGGGTGCSWPAKNRSGGKNGVSLGTLGSGDAGAAGHYRPVKIL